MTARRCMGIRVLVRGAAVATLALATGACGSLMNVMPDPADFHLPDAKTFTPTNVTAYAKPVSATGEVPASELVDAQGICVGAPAGLGPADASPGTPGVPQGGGVALEMTECQVVRVLGPPQQVEFGGPPRSVVLTYTTGDRAGIYRFVDGRLASAERGAEPPPPPPVAKKPPPKKKPKPPAPA
jgi:hypothetical protein